MDPSPTSSSTQYEQNTLQKVYGHLWILTKRKGFFTELLFEFTGNTNHFRRPDSLLWNHRWRNIPVVNL